MKVLRSIKTPSRWNFTSNCSIDVIQRLFYTFWEFKTRCRLTWSDATWIVTSASVLRKSDSSRTRAFDNVYHSIYQCISNINDTISEENFQLFWNYLLWSHRPQSHFNQKSDYAAKEIMHHLYLSQNPIFV